MSGTILVVARGWNIEPWVSRLAAALPGHRIIAGDREGEYPGPDSELAEVDYLLAWKPSATILGRLPNLKLVSSFGAGVDHLFASGALPDVAIVRIVDPDLTARMSEYVAWQCLHHLRRGFEYNRQQTARIWDDLPQPAAREVTVGIMGLGVLGADAAGVLGRIGFEVRGWSRTPKALDGVKCFADADGLDAFLGGTDILVVLVPLTKDTRGLVDRALLQRLRRGGALGGPVLINAARGGVHVEADVIAALADGTLLGASLDVFAKEPLPPESPLWGCDNLVITPHVAAVSDPAALSGQLAAQIRAFERGEPLRNRVDRSRGY
jgi:glyoxylate/hydroxypyruvate reductase A